MPTIVTKSNAAKREITVEMPKILLAESIEDIVRIQGADLTLSQVKQQLTVAFRAKVRNMLERTDDNGDQAMSDDAIIAAIDPDWKPELRVTKSAEEKAMDLLGGLSPEQRKLVLAQAKALK